MSITAIFVIFAVTWFLTLFVVLPIGQRSQEDAGEIVPGTPAGAPANAQMKRKAMITTVAALIITTIICTVIISGLITVEDFDWAGRG
ncbi:DUF1467 family protein [Pontivivens insulae]|uniref:Uncharacterized protein n=1 Tax=Pontivivens insulae TaxID=1639689 RepID=A0A2R8ADK0_9RHOB|nr:DUF1467 family protein [Pontivivens insulae]RED14071.1 putative secreted protein [Pontivivens insulae]SPF30145.1 hypothetical protein POI8812_02477 [Pontivivens insulae]